MKIARRSLVSVGLAGALFLLFAGVAAAQTAGAADNENTAKAMKYLAAAIAMGLGSLGPGLGIGLLGVRDQRHRRGHQPQAQRCDVRTRTERPTSGGSSP